MNRLEPVCKDPETNENKPQQHLKRKWLDWMKYISYVLVAVILIIAVVILLSTYKEEVFFESDIPVRWFMDVIVVCLSILLFVLAFKFFVAIIRYSFYMWFRHNKNMDVLNEAVKISQALLELDSKNAKDECSESLWYMTISQAYVSLGKIEMSYNKIGFLHSDKKKIANLHSTLSKELNTVIKMKNEEKEGNNTVAQSLRNVNKAIVDYFQ